MAEPVLSRRALLRGATGAAAGLAVPAWAMSGCSAAAGIAIAAGPLLRTVLWSAANTFGMEIGKLAAEVAAEGLKDIIAAGNRLKQSIVDDQSVSVLDAGKIAFHYARAAANQVSDGQPLFLVTALWRQADGNPASRVISGTAAGTVDIPTPAQLGIGLLAQRRTAAWIGLLERQGQCISQSALAQQSVALFAPGKAADVMSQGVAIPSVATPAQYRYWTADGGRVTIDWNPKTDPKAADRTTVDVSFTAGPQFQLANVAGLPTESHDSFAFSDVWTEADKGAVPVVDLGKPPDLANPARTVPSGQGTLHGTAVVSVGPDGRQRLVSITAAAAGNINGTVYINLSGTPRGEADVDPAPGLPMTMSFVPGGCAQYAGTITKSGNVLSGILSGPAGLVTAIIQYTPDQRPDRFFGVLTLTPQTAH